MLFQCVIHIPVYLEVPVPLLTVLHISVGVQQDLVEHTVKLLVSYTF